MSIAVERAEPGPDTGLIGAAPSSPAGPIDAADAAALPAPPEVPLPRCDPGRCASTSARSSSSSAPAAELGEVFRMRGIIDGAPSITCHPDHVQSLFTAKPEQAPSLTGESPLRPIVGPNSVLTALGPRHMRQRKLLLPPFHGEAVARYAEMIADAAEREIDRWPVGRAVRARAADAGDHARRDHGRDLRDRGEAGRPGTPEHRLRDGDPRAGRRPRRWPVAQLAELMNIGRDEPVGLTRSALGFLDRPTYALIAAAPQGRGPRGAAPTSCRC